MPRQASEDALIWQMTRKSYEARQRYMTGGGQWGSLSQDQRDIEYDAVWHALHELLMPSDEMVLSGCIAGCEWGTPWRNASWDTDGTDGESRKRLRETFSDAFRAMINKLLEV